MSMSLLDSPVLRRRAYTIKILVGGAVAVVGAWVAFGWPIPASRAWVKAEVAEPRIDALEGRADIAELRLFVIDWTARQSTLDAQSRAMVESERSRVTKSAAEINLRLQQARQSR